MSVFFFVFLLRLSSSSFCVDCQPACLLVFHGHDTGREIAVQSGDRCRRRWIGPHVLLLATSYRIFVIG